MTYTTQTWHDAPTEDTPLSASRLGHMETGIADAHTALDGKQPLDSDLTALAALTSPATKLSGIATGATANDTDANLKNRTNHTGTQTASTISDFSTAADARITAATLYKPGGTDVALADGGTGASLADPNADRILFWDDSAGAVTWLTPGTNLTVTGTTIDATGGGGSGTVTPTSTDTFSNKSIDLATNTVTMTKAQLNTAISDGDAYVTGGTDVPISDGGTGVSTLPSGILKGAGTSAITAAVAGTDFVGIGGALGTPSSGTLTNCSGLPSSGIAATLTGKRITPRVSTTASSATPTINSDTVDMFGITALAVDVTSMTTNLSGTPTDGQVLWLYFVGTGTRAITWGASFEDGAYALPTTVGTTRLDVFLVWNAGSSKWRCMETSAPSPRVLAITSNATPAINTDVYDAVSITALAAAITSMSSGLTGTPRNFQRLVIRIKDNGTARAISWGTSFEDGSQALPLTTVAGKTLLVALVYDAVDAKWACEAQGSRA